MANSSCLGETTVIDLNPVPLSTITPSTRFVKIRDAVFEDVIEGLVSMRVGPIAQLLVNGVAVSVICIPAWIFLHLLYGRHNIGSTRPGDRFVCRLGAICS